MMTPWYKAFVVGAGFSLSLALTLLWHSACGAEQARARAALDTDLPVWVGQQVAFHVDLLSPTLFSGTPAFDLPNVPGAVLMKVEEPPTLSTEEIDGATYSIQRHDFMLFPQRAGILVIPAFQVRFAVAPAYGKPPVTQHVMLDPLKIEAKMPPGAEGLSMLISTTDLTVDDQWSPALDKDHTVELKVGDALTRTLKRRTSDVPGMVLPPIHFGSFDGLGVYPKPPVVEDATQRGDFTGQRTDIVTYMCETAGTYRLPAVLLPWFDVDDQQVKRVELPAVTLKVTANPSLAIDTTSPSVSQPRSTTIWWWIGGLGGVMLITAVLFRRFYRPFMSRLRIWRSQRAAREAAYFARLKTACQAENPAEAFNALTRWIDSLYGGTGIVTIDQLVRDAKDDDLRRRIDQLERQLFAVPATPQEAWSGQAFYQRLAIVRQRLLQRTKHANLHAPPALPPLNPPAAHPVDVLTSCDR
jgi:hypothetical protein